MPDGNFHSYNLVESPVMEQTLAAAYPDIKTYAGQGIEDPIATIRCDITQFGFHAYIISANGIIYIDPFSLDNTNDYLVYFKEETPSYLNQMNCLLSSPDERNELNYSTNRQYEPVSVTSIGSQLRT